MRTAIRLGLLIWGLSLALVLLVTPRWRTLAAPTPQQSPNIPELDGAGCASRRGVWNSAQQGIPGDGNPHNFAVTAPNGTSQFLGGQARGWLENKDNGCCTFTCTLNPPQPASIQNSEQRRCTAPKGNDMSIESCTATTGSTGQLLCEYVNSTNAPSKMIELGGCWK